MIKYTLYCVNGRLFRPSLHFLVFGKWIPYNDPRITILCHGTLTDEECRQFKSQTYINIYQNNKDKIMSLWCDYNCNYLKRKKDIRDIITYAGSLKRLNEDLYVGEVRVK